MSRIISAILLTCAYWAVALLVAFAALLAPCGLAPGEWCELEGPNWFGSVLAGLGPSGVIVIAAAIYVATAYSMTRFWKAR